MILYAKPGENGNCLIGESPLKLLKYIPEPNELLIPIDQEVFNASVFKRDTATYCGYINGFSSRMNQKTGVLYVNDILTGGQVPFQFNIYNNGYFKVKIPLNNPQIVKTKIFDTGSVFLEPGKTIFQFIGTGNKSCSILYMGDGARTNNDLYKVKDIDSFNNSEMQDKILELSPEQYKLYCENNLKRDLNRLKDFNLDHRICGKANQIWEMNLYYRIAQQSLIYQWVWEIEWRRRNNIVDGRTAIPGNIPKIDVSFYSLLSTEIVNNPLALMTREYSSLLNRLRFILRGNLINPLPLAEFVEELIKSGISLNTEDKKLISQIKKVQPPYYLNDQNEFCEKYGKQMARFNLKYYNKLMPLYLEKKGFGITAKLIEDILTAQKIEFTEEEKELLTVMKDMQNKPGYMDYVQYQVDNQEEIMQFRLRNEETFQRIMIEKDLKERNNNFQKEFGIQPGLINDIMTAQDFNKSVIKQMAPFSDQQIQALQYKINDPFIKSWLKIKNDEKKIKIADNLKAKGSKVIEVSKNQADKVFTNIMSKYKGKVIFVDFWATWCGPCRAGIEQMKPLKEELANEKVTFVYISNQSSPIAAYNNMISGIKGDHYRLSTDEWNFISEKFKISGIPHYVLVGKNGNVINPHLMFMGNEQLKNLLMKYINE